jgi:hypothetical protein
VAVAQPTEGPGELANATLMLSWSNPQAPAGCSGTVTFVNGRQEVPGYTGQTVLSTMRLDVDRDGASEIVALLICAIGQTGPEQLVVVEPGTTPSTLGTVLETASVTGVGLLDPPDSPGVAAIRSYEGLSDGTIRIEVADRMTCCGTPPDSAVRQDRTFGWNGSSFQQTDGPTTFTS